MARADLGRRVDMALCKLKERTSVSCGDKLGGVRRDGFLVFSCVLLHAVSLLFLLQLKPRSGAVSAGVASLPERSSTANIVHVLAN